MTSKNVLRFNKMLFTTPVARSLQLFFVCLTLHLLFTACTRETTEEDAATKSQGATASANNKNFVFCSEGGPASFNPQIETAGTVFDATHHVYERLFDFKYGTTEVIPSLVENEWTVDEKGLEYTFDLKEGMKFHSTPYFTPTRDFNADDVLFSFNRQRDPKHPYHKVGGIYKYFQSMQMGNIIKDIVKVNEHRVKFILSEANAPFIANLAMDFTSILSKEYADKLLEAKTPEKIDHQPIGNGPFIFKEYVRDTVIRFEAFEDYSLTKRGNIKNLIFAITPDANVRLQKLKANECQLITYPAPADLEAIRRDTSLALMEEPGFNIGYLAMNTKKKPFDNKWVRQAVNYALNRKAYLQAVYLGNAEIAKNPLPPKSWGYHKGITGYDYNVNKAKALLKKAEVPNGFETDLWVLPVARPYIPSGKKLGEMMQADLARIGIKTRILTYDWPTYIDKVNKGEHTLAQYGWTGDNGDPDNFLYLLSCGAVQGQNLARWCHTPFDNLVAKAKVTSNHERRVRLQLYREAQMIFKEEAPWALLFHSIVHRGLRKNISGYKIDPLGRNIFTYVEMK